MTLSVLCPTRDPGPRVRALLEPLRDVADEIVVAVESTAGEDDLGHYAAVADRVLRFERGPRHSALAWLHAQCRGDWVLLLAGDEVCSSELVAALPELMRSRAAAQFAFSLRWLWPLPDRWLSGVPWYPDFHIRLMRNDGTLRFRGLLHELAIPAWPHRLLDLPLWHLSLLLADEHQRRRKVDANRSDRAGLQAAGGDELNSAFYLPEDRRSPALRAVPAADREQIDRVLSATRGTVARIDGLPIARRAEIDPFWSGREVGTGAFYATLTVLGDGELALRRGERRAVHVHVRNDGDERWPWGLDGEPPFRVAYRWHRSGRQDVSEPEGRGAFGATVLPGEDSIVALPVSAPAAAGNWDLEIDVVLEHVRWFGSPCRLAVRVR